MAFRIEAVCGFGSWHGKFGSQTFLTYSAPVAEPPVYGFVESKLWRLLATQVGAMVENQARPNVPIILKTHRTNDQ